MDFIFYFKGEFSGSPEGRMFLFFDNKNAKCDISVKSLVKLLYEAFVLMFLESSNGGSMNSQANPFN
jgi:hypothetical protein